MKKIKQIWSWYYFLNKRFLKKYIFTAILLCTPLLAMGISMLKTSDSGILTILLYNENQDGESQEVIEELKGLHGVVNYSEFHSLDAAITELNQGKADSLWVFPENLGEKFLEYYRNGKPFIKIYLREDNIQTRIVREQLFGTLYPKISYHLLNHFFKTHKFQNQDSDFQNYLDLTYDSFHTDHSLLEFAYIDGSIMEQQNENYLSMPLRGMLAIFLLMISMSVTMFYLQDVQQEKFNWMPIKNRALFPYFYILTATLNAAVLTYISLYFSGSFSNWEKEILLMTVYLFASTGFSNLLIFIFKDLKSMGTAILLISLVSLLLCPVFFNLNRFPLLQFLLPPYYYLNSIYNSHMLIKMIIFSIVTFLLAYFLNRKTVSQT